MLTQCQAYAPGNTDLAWTRLTPWRALLAAALDQHPLKVTGATVTAERISPSADLLVAWLCDRLKVRVKRGNSAGPGITEVAWTRGRDRSASRAPTAGWPRSPPPTGPTARSRSSGASPCRCSAEELRRLDEDDVYARTAAKLVALHATGAK